MERFRLPVAVNLLLIKDDTCSSNLENQEFPRGSNSGFPGSLSILLMKRFQTGFMDDTYCPVAGCIEGGESAREAMAREAFEEAGITIAPQDLQPAAVIHRHSEADAWESISFFFIAKTWQGTPYNREPHKCSDMAFFALNALPANIPPYIQAGIKASLEGPFFLEWGFT